MVVCRGANVRQVRAGSQRLFVTAALGFTQAVTTDEMLRAAFDAISAGADAVITARGYEMVRMLAAESIPVVGHLGFVPRKSTWVGAVRAVGKTAAEAMELWDRFRRLEDAGAFAAECELIPAAVLSRDQPPHLARHHLARIGADADVIFLFASDICGEVVEAAAPRAGVGDLAKLYGPYGTKGSRRSPASAPPSRPPTFPPPERSQRSQATNSTNFALVWGPHTKMTSDLTPRERVNLALSHRNPDRTPVDFLAVPENLGASGAAPRYRQRAA